VAILSSASNPEATAEVSATPSAVRVGPYNSQDITYPPAPKFIGSYFCTLPVQVWTAATPTGSNVFAIAMGTTNRRAIIRSINFYIATPTASAATFEILLFRTYLSAPSVGVLTQLPDYARKRTSYPTPDMQVAGTGSNLTFPGTQDVYPFASMSVPRSASGKKNPRHALKFHSHDESYDYFELKSWEGIVAQIGSTATLAAERLLGTIDWDEIE
jgi:hypothetical protein